ncbi:MAG: VOC family protein [Propionibacteriaceae bacterium]|nr:VOC family protein [Propionibacteriaceae bacterium]
MTAGAPVEQAPLRKHDATVRSLGYVRVDATDFAAWKAYAVDFMGLQLARETDDLLELRMDEKEYRIAITAADRDGVSAIGWEVAGPRALAELGDRLSAAGYPVTPFTPEELKARRISGGVHFPDPDGIAEIELFYALRESFTAFTSPTGARFVTGDQGLGHVFQFVEDWEAYRHLYFDLLGFRLSDFVDGGANQDVELTFLHCNPRHHSYAFGHIDGVPPGVGHLMFEVTGLDVVGRAWDQVVLKDVAPVVQTLGMHTNDKMISFYTGSPGGFAVEYGTGGIAIDEDTWTPTRYPGAHYWGHQRPKRTAS